MTKLNMLNFYFHQCLRYYNKMYMTYILLMLFISENMCIKDVICKCK